MQQHRKRGSAQNRVWQKRLVWVVAFTLEKVVTHRRVLAMVSEIMMCFIPCVNNSLLWLQLD